MSGLILNDVSERSVFALLHCLVDAGVAPVWCQVTPRLVQVSSSHLAVHLSLFVSFPEFRVNLSSMNNFYDRKDRTLFVSMIHKSITDDDLYALLSRAGPIEKVIFKENQDGTPLHALVIFRNVESVVFSMIHILPMVRSSKLIELRPLR
ncbi:unnamed protein product [Haemonchus placei]|uniref:RRM domain-containing protein n=1 Tax=Haemonchus placei TaxID=6290 RepID=A0A0N4X6Q5_HAEPC|nr:unnamed protein product [Haemonchus placei]